MGLEDLVEELRTYCEAFVQARLPSDLSARDRSYLLTETRALT